LTLEDAARRIGISRSFLSSLERGESGVSQRILSRISDVFRMPPSAFAPIRLTATPVIRAQDRPQTALEGGLTWQELASPGHVLEPALLTVAPQGSSGGAYSHQGETFVYLVAGSIVLNVVSDGSQITLAEGDSLILPPGATWSWHNPGDAEARVLWVEQLSPDAWA
jgi:transcriptional regulator with XRE-family HTH domain